MKKIMAILFSLLIYINPSFAFFGNDIPDEFYITQHWISLTSSFDIETKTQKLGTLYRRYFAFTPTYEFYDNSNNKVSTARARFLAWTAYFDIIDNQGVLLGAAEEELYTFFRSFDIYANDATTKTAKAQLNFWGTTFTIYDPESNLQMAKLHRSFIRLKNSWTFTVVNRALLMKKNIDPRVLLTVAAFQGDRELWNQDDDDFNAKALHSSGQAFRPASQQIKLYLDKIKQISLIENILDNEIPDSAILEAVANEVDVDYMKHQFKFTQHLTNQELTRDFIEYCLNLVQTNSISDAKKRAILYMLKMRLMS